MLLQLNGDDAHSFLYKRSKLDSAQSDDAIALSRNVGRIPLTQDLLGILLTSKGSGSGSDLVI